MCSRQPHCYDLMRTTEPIVITKMMKYLQNHECIVIHIQSTFHYHGLSGPIPFRMLYASAICSRKWHNNPLYGTLRFRNGSSNLTNSPTFKQMMWLDSNSSFIQVSENNWCELSRIISRIISSFGDFHRWTARGATSWPLHSVDRSLSFQPIIFAASDEIYASKFLVNFVSNEFRSKTRLFSCINYQQIVLCLAKQSNVFRLPLPSRRFVYPPWQIT